METISTTINLASTKHAIKKMKNKAGQEIDCLVIPIDDNHLFRSDKGGIYINLIGFPVKEVKNNQTHIIKQSFKKEYIDSLSDEEKAKLPIFGNHSIFSQQNNTGEVLELSNADDLLDDDMPY